MKRPAIAFSVFLGSTLSMLCSEVVAEQLRPLPDLTVDNISFQFERCAAFYTAFSYVLSDEIENEQDPLTISSLQDLKERAIKHADGLLLYGVVSLTTLNNMSDESATNRMVDARDGFLLPYLREFVLSESSVSKPFRSELWASDTASCSALVKHSDSLLEGMTNQ